MSKAIGSVFAAGYSGDGFNDEEEKKENPRPSSGLYPNGSADRYRKLFKQR